MDEKKVINFVMNGQDNTSPAFNQITGRLQDGTTAVGLFNTALGMLGVGLSLGALSTDIFNVTKEFQTLRASLKTAVGGDDTAALAVFDKLKDFAKNTPYDMQQVINAFISLKNFGLTPSIEALTSYGNTASGMGKSLSSMIEAVADATVGEFERLKAFGIKAKSEGDQVSLTFQGVTTTIGKNAREIEQYLINLGNVQFAGAMAEKMGTLDGSISNLKDSWSQLMDAFGQMGPDNAITVAIQSLSGILDLVRRTVAETDVEKLGRLRGELQTIQEQIGAAQATPGLAWAYGGLDNLIQQESRLKGEIADVEAKVKSSDEAFKKATETINGAATATNSDATAKNNQKTATAAAEEAAKRLTEQKKLEAEAADKAREAATKAAIEMERIASNERIKKVEMLIGLQTEKLKADVQTAQAIIGTLNTTISSTGNLLGGLFGNLVNAKGFGDKWLIEDQIRKESDRRDKAIEQQGDLIEAQVKLMEAKTTAISRGEGLMKIEMSGVEPELEAIMWKIVERVQARVNEEASEFLIGLQGAQA